VLDRAGRLQLPRAHINKLNLVDRVRLRLEDDHVGVWPSTAEEAPEPPPPPPPATDTEQWRRRP